MGLIKEPLDVDFTVDPRELTKAEKSAISEYIRNYKIKKIGEKATLSVKDKSKIIKATAVKH
jgi:hypothetical protein